MNPDQPIDLIILAGGQGRRLGGRNKALLTLGGESFLQHLRQRFLRPDDQLIIASNEALPDDETVGAIVVADRRSGGAGPLAGLESALAVCRHAAQLVIPCDMPWLPEDLRQRLLAALASQSISVAQDPQRLQPLCLALHGGKWLKNLSDFLDRGERSAQRWLSDKPAVTVVWPDAAPFRNVNEPQDLPER